MRRGLFGSRTAARRAIAEDRVVVDGVVSPRPATMVAPSAGVSLRPDDRAWVSRGGDKLAGALDVLEVAVTDRHCLDVGASTGGFTDVLLAHGAATVVALDVGYGQLAWRLRNDDRVTVVERTNIRHADPQAIGAPFDLIVADVSFISIATIAAALASCGRAGSDYVLLVKPQFEVGKDDVSRGGLVTDPVLHARAIEAAASALADHGVGPLTATPSPITGAKGNREFFLHARRGATPALDHSVVERLVVG